MQASEKICVLSAHDGRGWYWKGQQRLKNSLYHHGYNWDFVGVRCVNKGGGWDVIDEERGKRFHSNVPSSTPYTLKIAAFEYALSLGYEIIVWLDCSVWAIKNPNPFFDVIGQEGYYFWPCGFSIGQTCNQRTLDYFGLTRQQALQIPDSSTSMFGLHMGNPFAQAFYKEWREGAYKGLFEGPRDELKPPRNGQKFAHRQDQSVASCAIWKHALELTPVGEWSYYANDAGKYPEGVTFVMRGM